MSGHMRGDARKRLVDAAFAPAHVRQAEVEALLVEARAEALREAADRMPAFHDRDVPEWAITSACRWLRERADRIAGGAS